MDIYQLRVFLSVYRNRSFSAASAELHLTQPSVSIHIKKLEEELGVRVFDRVGRKVIPTREGDLLYDRAEELVLRLQDIKRDLALSGKAVRGNLDIGASAIPGNYVFPLLAADFTKRHPEVLFRVTIDESRKIAERVAAGELLLGAVDAVDCKGSADLVSLHTFLDELVLVAAPGFVGRKEISPLKLFSLPLLLRDEGSDARSSMEKQHLLHRVSLKALKVKAVLGSVDALREAVKAGLGVTILSRFVVRDDLKAGLVEEIRIKGVRMSRDCHIIGNRKRTLPEHYRAFAQFLSEKLPAS